MRVLLAALAVALAGCTATSTPAPAETAEVVANVPSAGWSTVISGCMRSAGFADYVIAESDDEQRALDECVARYPAESAFSVYPSSAQLEQLYDYYRDTLVPCLAAHGFVSQGEAPSREEFTAARGQRRWTPYDALETRPPDAVRQRCAALPFSTRE